VRIAVASDDGARVAQHTGRCAGFVVYEVLDKTAQRLEYRENRFTAHARGECAGESDAAAGHAHHAHHSHAALVDALADCCVLVTRGLGPRLVADLAARGVDAYVCPVESVDDAATLFARGALPRAGGCGCQHHGA